MNIKDFAKKIDGFEYPARELQQYEQEAKDNGFIFIYGMSDDLLEFRGVIDDEIGACDGLKTKIGSAAVELEAEWSPEECQNTSWKIHIDCPHEIFRIMEDGEVFCYGAVIHHLNIEHKSETAEQIKANAINEFVCSMIGALESGFIDTNKPTLAEIHRVAQNYCKDKYSIQLPHILEQWGEDTAALCGYIATNRG